MGCADDRAVRDLERKAALMHFSTEDASRLTAHPPPDSDPTPPGGDKWTNPRIAHVASLARTPFG